MRVLITGANGFLGSTLFNQLQKTNHTILPFVRKKKSANDIECNVGNASNFDLWRAISEKSQAICDGFGVKRIKI